MLKRRDWLRKSQRRLIQQKDRGIVDFMRIVHHFFRSTSHVVKSYERTTCGRLLHLYTGNLCNDGIAEKCLCAEKHAFYG